MRLQTDEDRSVPAGEKNLWVGSSKKCLLSNGMGGFANCTDLVKFQLGSILQMKSTTGKYCSVAY